MEWFIKGLGVVLVLATSSALAADPKALGKNGKWEAYYYKKGSHRICYMLGNPEKSEGAKGSRSPVFAFVTHRPRSRQFDEVTFDIGYTFKADTKLTVTIDDQKFTLSTDRNRAWADDVQTDKRLVQAMKNGSEMVIEATSSRDSKTTDTFPLKGFTASYRLISDECR